MDAIEVGEVERPSRTIGKLQFRISHLLIVAAIVAVMLTLLVTLVPPLWVLAMVSPSAQGFFGKWFGQGSFGLVRPWEYEKQARHIVVWVGVSLLLVKRWNRHLNVSRCALVALAGFFILEVLDVGISTWGWTLLQNQPPPPNPGCAKVD